ncbi:MAG: methyltransferase domain-containing protein [Candidatus Thermoplasmatota archaeon]|nr:methyltransferase domain-containing protein [Candidatus Thermoplasmatota archaeon]MBU1941816.1 methyltransferase domain-containing protein [Candidatus Thermoplasmatota archaeon]
MLLLCELAKEFHQLPQQEALAILTAEDIPFKVVTSNEDILLLDVQITPDGLNRFVTRSALCHVVNECLLSSPPNADSFHDAIKELILKDPGTIAVRARNRSMHMQTQPLMQLLADHVTKNHAVNLIAPDIEIRLIVTDDGWYVGRKIADIPRNTFEQRRVHHRPYFSPISLHPKLARTLVNISQISENQTLLDPFCGTGGILLEAGMIGANLIGNDIEEKMIKGCSETLTHFNITQFTLYNMDIGSLPTVVAPVDAIVTDLPYGKSTTTKGEELMELYTRAFASFYHLIKPHGMIIAGGSLPEIGHIAEQRFTLDVVYTLRVHRSLTRYFVHCHH